MTNDRTTSSIEWPVMSCHLLTILLVLSTLLGFSTVGYPQDFSERRTSESQTSSKEMPVVQWTAGRDPLNFRFDFLENLETTVLHTATPETGTWNHHQHIFYHEGVLYAVWDTQIRDENAAGQHGLLRRSADQGRTWRPVEVLFPPSAKNLPAAGPYPETRFQTFNGFALVDDMLYAVTNVAEWTEAGAKKIRPRVKIGRMGRSIDPDGTLGKIFWLLPEAPDPVAGFPAYPAGDPVLVEKIEAYFQQPGNEIQLSFGGGHPDSDDEHGLGEPVPSYQASDGTWVRLYRDGGSIYAQTLREEEATKSRRNYVSFSFDDGKTWTVPTRTSFPDACARSTAGRLPDGQVYVVNNVLPLSTKKGGRSLLAISLSRDGLNFDRVSVIRFIAPSQRYEGRSKSVGYAYPHSVVVGDDLLVIHSVNKEDIHLTRVPLDELYKIR